MIQAGAAWAVVHEGAWPSLGEAEVHVWRLDLAVAPGRLERLAAALEVGESERADRFVFPKDRDRFVAARGLLREILGGYTGLDPSRIRFAYGPGGKPRWESPSDAPAALDFNLSHSSTVALLAVSRGGPVGIDCEEVRPGYADDGIADRFFTPDEAASLRTTPAEGRDEAFFRVWTRKEAVVKASGEGLAAALDGDSVAGAPDGGWILHDLVPAPGYVAALAARGAARIAGYFSASPAGEPPQAGRRSTSSRPIANADVAAGEGALST